MWSNLYMIRVNTKAFILLAIFIIIFVWYYVIENSHHLTHLVVTKNTINVKSLLIASILSAQLGGHEVIRVYKSNNLDIHSKGKTKEGMNDMLTRADLKSHTIMIQSLSTVYPNLKIISEEHTLEDEYNGQINPFAQLRNINAKLNSDEFSMFDDNVEVPISELIVWIDPLDATFEYTQSLVDYVTTMVCVARNGVPIIGVIHKPFNNQTYWGFNKHVSSNFKSYTVSANNSFRILVSRSHAGDVKKLIENTFKENIEIIAAAGSGYKTIELINGNGDAYIHNTLIKKWDICAPNAILNAIDSGRLTTLKGDSVRYSSDSDDQVFVKNGILATVDKDHDKIIQLLNGANEK